MPDVVASLIRPETRQGIPWTRNVVPLNNSTVALVSVGGLYVKGQPAFREANLYGDFGFRTIPHDVASSSLSFSKYMVDSRYAKLDVNMLFPIERLREMKAQGFIKNVAQNHYSFYGHTLNANRVVEGSAKDVARRLRYEGVDKVVVIPATVLSQETALLVQRSIEEEGIPTVSLVYTAQAVKALNPPRACSLGKGSLDRLEEYLDTDVQANLMQFMLSQFDQVREPGQTHKVVMRMAKERHREMKESTPPTHEVQKDLFQ